MRTTSMRTTSMRTTSMRTTSMRTIPRSRPSIHRVSSILLASALFWAASAVAQKGHELPSAPEARRGFVPGPVPQAVEPATPSFVHPPELGQGFPGKPPVLVRFTDGALSQVPPALGSARSHVQGELVQRQGEDATERPVWRTSSIDHRRPQMESTHQKALGDLEQQFDGLSNTGWIPPDTVLAVGSEHVVEAVNSGFGVYSKSGTTLQGYRTFDDFYGPALPEGWLGFLFDPRVLFSPEHQKFVMLVLGRDDTNQDSYAFVAVSLSDNARGLWWLFAIEVSTGVSSDAWLDYAGLGADLWGIYITGNYFFWAGSGFKTSTIISLTPEMFNGSSPDSWRFTGLTWPGGASAFAIQPALPLTVAGGALTFFVNSLTSFGNQLLLWTLSGDRINSPSLTRMEVDVASYAGLGENVPQPGTTTMIDGGDARIMNAFYSQRRVYTTLTNDTDGDGSSSGAFLAKINVDSHLTEWNTTLDGGNSFYYFYPAIVPGDPFLTSPPVSVFLTLTSPLFFTYASAAVRTYGGPPADTSGPFPIFGFGEGPYVSLDGNGSNRWGDYSGAGYDFTNDTVWGAVEIAGSGNTWRTRIAELKNPIFADGFESGNTSAWSTTVP